MGRKQRKRKIVFLPLVIERNGDGFLVRCPLIQGAFAEGDTVVEAIFNCLDVINLIAAYRKERGEPLLDVLTEEFTLKKQSHSLSPLRYKDGATEGAEI